jgi:hypothetical protein
MYSSLIIYIKGYWKDLESNLGLKLYKKDIFRWEIYNVL